MEIDARTLTPSDFAPMLRRWAQGVPNVEAATNLIIDHNVWLRRIDFLRACVVIAEDGFGRGSELPMAAISWQRAATFVNGAAASRSEIAVLRLACSLGGVSTAALGDLTSGLDPAITARVLDAIGPRGWLARAGHPTHGRRSTGPGPCSIATRMRHTQTAERNTKEVQA